MREFNCTCERECALTHGIDNLGDEGRFDGLAVALAFDQVEDGLGKALRVLGVDEEVVPPLNQSQLLGRASSLRFAFLTSVTKESARTM